MSGRSPGDSDGFSERVALALVDFYQTDAADLERYGFLLPNHDLSLGNPTPDEFVSDL